VDGRHRDSEYAAVVGKPAGTMSAAVSRPTSVLPVSAHDGALAVAILTPNLQTWTEPDSVDPGITYIGTAICGADGDDPVWRIQRVSPTPSGGSRVQFALDSDDLPSSTFMFDDRETLTYG
jgi:hypothetical protein